MKFHFRWFTSASNYQGSKGCDVTLRSLSTRYSPAPSLFYVPGCSSNTICSCDVFYWEAHSSGHDVKFRVTERNFLMLYFFFFVLYYSYSRQMNNYIITMRITTIFLRNLHCYVFRHFPVTIRQFTASSFLSYVPTSNCNFWKYNF